MMFAALTARCAAAAQSFRGRQQSQDVNLPTTSANYPDISLTLRIRTN
jgi:hypothetical protein